MDATPVARQVDRGAPVLAVVAVVVCGLTATAGASPVVTTPEAEPVIARPLTARPPTPERAAPWRLVHLTSVMARENPLGLAFSGRLTLNRRLFVAEGAALRENFVALGVVAGLAAASARIGVIAELQPATFLNLWATAEGIGYFGMFGQMNSFVSATVAYDDETLRERARNPEGRPYASTGSHYMVGATLRARAGWLVARTRARLARSSADLRAGDRVFYDLTNDVLVEDGGWTAANDLDVVWEGQSMMAGLRWSAARSFYGDAAFAPGDDPSLAPGWLQRLGPLVTKQWHVQRGNMTMTLFGHAGWWLLHPSRTGLLPMAQIGLTMTGDIFGTGR